MLEIAKSGRAKCRKCKQAIAKGELRFGEETVNQFSDSGEPSYFWYHLPCAAKAKPRLLKADLEAYDGEVPERAELEKTIAASAGKEKPGKFPYAEKAPSGRSRCLACELAIEKDTLRVAIEREVDTGSFVTKGAGYLHPRCAPEFVEEPEGLLEQIKANSTSLDAAALAELEAALGS